jgi:hypothetical protein
MKGFTLLHWGGLLILAGALANVVTSMIPPPPGDQAARGFAFGRGVTTLAAVVTGVVLIVLHFVRRARP